MCVYVVGRGLGQRGECLCPSDEQRALKPVVTKVCTATRLKYILIVL